MRTSARCDRQTLVTMLEVAGISERELARRAGLGHATVNHLVTRRRQYCTPEVGRRIADVLDCEYSLLFTEVV